MRNVFYQLVFFTTALVSTSLHSTSSQVEFNRSGYNVERVENEYKLTVPKEKISEVWDYLQQRFKESDSLFLKEFDPSFSTEFSTEVFIDTYFDTPSLELLRMESGIRRRTRLIPDNPNHKKHGRSLIQIKLKREGESATNRTEVKFKVDPRYSFLNGNDRPPIHLIDKNRQKRQFTERVTQIGIDPGKLSEKFTLKQIRRRVYISKSGSAFATITLDHVESEKWWKKVTLVEVELELNEIKYTEGSEEEREKMQKINNILKKDLQERFHYISEDLTPKYNKIYNLFKNEHPLFSLLKYLL